MDKNGTYALVILAAVALVALVGVIALATEPAWGSDENAAGFAKSAGAKKSKSESNDHNNNNRLFNSG